MINPKLVISLQLVIFFFKQSSKLVLIMFTFPNEEKETQMCS